MSLFQRSKVKPQTAPNCAGCILYDRKTFYNRFCQDLLKAQEEVIIESPFISDAQP